MRFLTRVSPAIAVLAGGCAGMVAGALSGGSPTLILIVALLGIPFLIMTGLATVILFAVRQGGAVSPFERATGMVCLAYVAFALVAIGVRALLA
ncbi:MAG: hypothetical protein H0W72_06700 [Planctomycetes bacterium]|nr:hypothetical protein [Planctomycetota bacterium]